MDLLNQIKDGKFPEVPFRVTVDDKSIIKIGVAALLISVIIIMVAAVVKIK